MNQIRLPALSGDSPLGILAAMGVLRLLTDHGIVPTRLSWAPDDLVAVLHTEHADLDVVADVLVRIVETVPVGAALPGLPRGFPPEGAAPDRLRVKPAMLRSDTRDWVSGLSSAEQTETWLWLASLVTDLAVDAQQGRVAISQFTAPSGKQSMSTMLLKPLEMVRAKPDYLRQALAGWRRVDGVTGEYLDHRALWDAVEAGDGRTGNMRGVPGATWLALMSFPLFRSTERRRRSSSSGWHTVSVGRRRVDELRLPVWDQPLGPAAVTTLVEHPLLAPHAGRRAGEDQRAAARREREQAEQLKTLGVRHVCRARRRQPPGSKSAGVLTTEL